MLSVANGRSDMPLMATRPFLGAQDLAKNSTSAIIVDRFDRQFIASNLLEVGHYHASARPRHRCQMSRLSKKFSLNFLLSQKNVECE